jgi:hypothetical protein
VSSSPTSRLDRDKGEGHDDGAVEDADTDATLASSIEDDLSIQIYCGLPATLQLIKTAPSILGVVLSFDRALFSVSLKRGAPHSTIEFVSLIRPTLV